MLYAFTQNDYTPSLFVIVYLQLYQYNLVLDYNGDVTRNLWIPQEVIKSLYVKLYL